MALIKCIECGKYVSDKNKLCSSCKAPIAKSVPAAGKGEGSKWESAGLFMAATGALTLLIVEQAKVTGIIMTVCGLIVYAAGKFLIGKYI